MCSGKSGRTGFLDEASGSLGEKVEESFSALRILTASMIKTFSVNGFLSEEDNQQNQELHQQQQQLQAKTPTAEAGKTQQVVRSSFMCVLFLRI